MSHPMNPSDEAMLLLRQYENLSEHTWPDIPKSVRDWIESARKLVASLILSPDPVALADRLQRICAASPFHNSDISTIHEAAELLRAAPQPNAPPHGSKITGIEAAKIVADYIELRSKEMDAGDAANIIHILHESGVAFLRPDEKAKS